jgi:hypothetical protein
MSVSDDVKKLEEEIFSLKRGVRQAVDAIQSFCFDYDGPEPEMTLPKSRDCHTHRLRDVLRFVGADGPLKEAESSDEMRLIASRTHIDIKSTTIDLWN